MAFQAVWCACWTISFGCKLKQTCAHYASRGSSPRFGAVGRVSFWDRVSSHMFGMRACGFTFIVQPLCWKKINLKQSAGDFLSALGCLRAMFFQRWLVDRRYHFNLRLSTTKFLSRRACLRQTPFQHLAICRSFSFNRGLSAINAGLTTVDFP